MVRLFSVLCILFTSIFLNAQSEKIVGGKPLIKAPSWIVRLHKDKETFCTGSLIAPQYVLTAAHCHLGWDAGSMKNVRVTVGSSNMSSLFGETRSISEVKYAKESEFILSSDAQLVNFAVLYGYDHLILKLNRPVGAAPIRLATPQEIKAMESSKSRPKPYAIGFGTTTEYATDPAKILQIANGLNLLDPSECLQQSDYSNLMCVTSVTNMICRGDSGGPLVVMLKDGPVQIGVASFISPTINIRGNGICDPETTMGTYSSISNNYSWIIDQLK